VPPTCAQRYVMRAKDPRRPEVRMAPELRARLSVARLNLMDDAYPAIATST
jgi:chemotaxis protein methyltransferase CheR